MLEHLEAHFGSIAPSADFCSLRFVHERSERLTVRQNILQPVAASEDMGAMLTVVDGGGMGYAGTSDLSLSGLRQAAGRARDWARQTAGCSVVDFSKYAAADRSHGCMRTLSYGEYVDVAEAHS